MNPANQREKRKSTGLLTLSCPRCAAKGSVTWDRLDRPLRCRGCARWYRVEGTQLVEIRAPARQGAAEPSAPQAATAVARNRKPSAPASQIAGPGRAALVVAVLVLVAISGWWWKGSAAPASEASSLSEALTERAPRFTEAWSTHQVAAMAPFVAPANVPGWKDWVAKTARPAPLADVDSSDLTIGTIAVQEQPGLSRAIVDVQVVCKSQPGAGPLKPGQYIQRQVWQKQGQEWFFQPTETLTAMAQYQGR